MTQSDASPPKTLDALTVRIQEQFAAMTPQFQVGARYLLDFPAEVPVRSMRQIAAQAGVQPATLVRLAQTLGYGGWSTLKQVFVRSLQDSPRRYTDQARQVIRGRNTPDIVSKTLSTQANNIRLLDELNSERMAAAVAHIAQARHVYVSGFRASFAAAFSFHYLYRLFRSSVSLLRGDAGTLEMDLGLITSRDAVVMISFAPYSHETMRVLEASHQAGARVIALCDSMVAPIALKADSVLLFSTETPSFFPSVSSAVALCEVIIEQLLARSGRTALAGLKRSEDRLHATGAYINVKP